MPKRLDAKVMDEDGLVVEFSNGGTKHKKIYFRYRNPKKELVKCKVRGCQERTRAQAGVCKNHRNKHSCTKHSVDWVARIVAPRGTRGVHLTNSPGFGDLTESLWAWAAGNRENVARVTRFFNDCISQVPGKIPDATSLQDAYEGNAINILTPSSIISLAKKLIEKHFPKKNFQKITTKNNNIIKDRDNGIPIRLISTLLLLGYICEESNRGDLWYINRIKKSIQPRYAGCYMAAGHFLFRRHTNATPGQIRMSLKG